MHLDVIFGHLRRDGLQFRDQPLQPVGILLPRHQHGVLRRHHHEIVDAFERDQRAVGRDVAIAGILEHGGAAARHCPAPSLSDNSHTACQEPTSDQPQATGTTAARAVFSITA